MHFSPANPIVQLCLQGMAREAENNSEEAHRLFLQAWNEATNDFEKYLAAYYVARHQPNEAEKLAWLERSLAFAKAIDNATVKAAYPVLYLGIAQCYEGLGDADKAKKYYEWANSFEENPSDPGPFYHGTRANLKVGDFLTPGNKSNYAPDLTMNHIYFTALVHGAGLAAGLAKGEGAERVYIVEPTGAFENDPNVTNKKFPGNPTRSYRTEAPLKIIGEVHDWEKQTPQELEKWKEKLANNKGAIIN